MVMVHRIQHAAVGGQPTPMCCDVQKLHQSVQGWASKVMRLFCCNRCILAEIQSGRHVYPAHTLYLVAMCHDIADVFDVLCNKLKMAGRGLGYNYHRWQSEQERQEGRSTNEW